MGEYSQELPNMHPATGRVIKEDGTTKNIADAIITDINGNEAVRTTATMSGDVNVDQTSINVNAYVGKPLGTNGDFVTARTGDTTFTCATLPVGVAAIKSEDIELIRQISAAGVVVASYSRDDVTITVAGTDPTTVTVAGAVFGATDTIIVYTNISKTNFIASSSKPAAVATGAIVRPYFDIYGRQRVYDEGGGGVGGGGFMTYVFDSLNSFRLGTTLYVAATQFSVSGHNFTPNPAALIKIDRFSSAGAYQETITPYSHVIAVSTTSGVSTYTVTGMAASAGDTFVVYQQGPERTITNSSDSQRIDNINPLSYQTIPDSWVDTTNVAAATVYYPSALGYSNDGTKDESTSYKFIDADGTITLTHESTNDEDQTNADWVDDTKALYDRNADATGASSFTVTNGTMTGILDSDNNSARFSRWKVVYSGSTNTAILKSKRKAL